MLSALGLHYSSYLSYFDYYSSKTDSGVATALILWRELTPHSLVFPQVSATDRRTLLGNDFLEQRLADRLVLVRLFFDSGIEHLSCR